MNRIAWIALTLLLALPAAMAHAEPIESSPGWNERLDISPDRVTVTFSEPLYEQGSFIQILNSDREQVDNGDLRIDNGANPVMTVTIPDLPDGGYLIVWQTYSQTDGHVIGGSFGFSIGPFAPPSGSVQEQSASLLGVAGRAFGYLAMTIVLGPYAYRLAVERKPLPENRSVRFDRSLILGAMLLAIGSILLLWDVKTSTNTSWAILLGSVGGKPLLQRSLVALGLFVLSALWLMGPVQPRRRYAILLVLWLVPIALAAQVGHAMGTFAHMVQFVHALSIASWIGGLAWYLWSLPKMESDEELTLMGRRFGTLGLLCVVTMALTGLALTTTILGPSILHVGSTWSDPWRRALALKVLLATGMVGLAAWNKLRLVPGGRSTKALLQRSIRIEAILGVLTLVAAAMLMSLGAPADAATATTSETDVTAYGNAYTGRLVIAPEPVQGESRNLRLYLEDSDGEPLRDNTCAEGREDCVQVDLWAEEDGRISAVHGEGVPQGDGWWVFEDLLFTRAGNFTAEVTASSAFVFEDILSFDLVSLARSD